MLSKLRTVVCVALFAGSSIAAAQSDGGFLFAEPLEAFAARSLASHVNSTRENTEFLAQQVGPRPGLRWGWGKNLKARSVKWSASTVFVLDKHGIVRLGTSATESDLANNAWLIRAALERAQGEP